MTFAKAIEGSDTRALASCAGVSTQAASAWKNGSALPSIDKVEALAAFLGRDFAWVAQVIAKDAAARRGSK